MTKDLIKKEQGAVDSPKTIGERINAIMHDMSAIGKDRKNAMQGYAYRGIEDYLNAIKPLLTTHGVYTTIDDVEGLTYETYSNSKGSRFNHVKGKVVISLRCSDHESVQITRVPAEAVDTSDKATPKLLSMAYKYFLSYTFSVPTEDMADAEKEHPVIPPDAEVDFDSIPDNSLGEESEAPELLIEVKQKFSDIAITKGKTAKFVEEALLKEMRKKGITKGVEQMNEAQSQTALRILNRWLDLAVKEANKEESNA